MQGLMQDYPLTIPHLFVRAEQLFSDKEVVTATATGIERTTYGAWAERTRRLGGVLDDLGISGDGRVATFAWNTASPRALLRGALHGRVSHAEHPPVPRAAHLHRQPRRGRGDLRRPVADPLLWPLLKTFETVRHLVVMDDGKGTVPDEGADGFEIHDYEELLAAASAVTFSVDDENRAASMCYTSGTTGNRRVSSTPTARRSSTRCVRRRRDHSGRANLT
jgi:fatty-acyl-CoA synthase